MRKIRFGVSYNFYYRKSEYRFVVFQKNENQDSIGWMMDFYNIFSVILL